MRSLAVVPAGLLADPRRFATLVGLASVPFTVLLAEGAITPDATSIGATVPAAPLVASGMVVGYRFGDDARDRRRAGVSAGLVGSIGTAIVFLAGIDAALPIDSTRATLVASGISLALVAVGVVLTVGLTLVGSVLGGMVHERIESRRRRETRAGRGGSNWWRVLPIYVLLAPSVLGYMLLVRPIDGAGFLIVWVGLLVLVVISLMTLPAVAIDASAFRAVDGAWDPNVWAYVGLPVVTYLLVSLVRDYQGSTSPSGDAAYGYFVALWATTVVYLLARRRFTADDRASMETPRGGV